MGEKQTVILGGGVTGAIAAFYLPDSIVIDKGVTPEFLGPHYVWDTPETRKLCEDLGLPINKRKVRIGVWYDGKFVEPDARLRNLYRLKLDDMTASMSELNDTIDVIDITFEALHKALLDRIKDRLRVGTVTRVTQTKVNSTAGTFDADEIISTIPLIDLLELMGQKTDKLASTYQPLTFVLIDLPKSHHFWKSGYDYIYFPGPDELFYRLTLGEPCVLEFVNSTVVIPQDATLISIRRKKYGRITKKIEADVGNIKLLGRYGRWEPRWRLQDTIREVLRWKS
jgi:hypothetical protein